MDGHQIEELALDWMNGMRLDDNNRLATLKLVPFQELRRSLYPAK
jgi:hypothetical protein